jgi:hypothetical protein
MKLPVPSRMIKRFQRPTQLAQLASKVKQQLHRLNLNLRQRHSPQITQHSHKVALNNLNPLTRSRSHHTWTKRNPLAQMPQHRILRLEHFAFLVLIRYLEHKLFTITTREKKVPVALTR